MVLAHTARPPGIYALWTQGPEEPHKARQPRDLPRVPDLTLPNDRAQADRHGVAQVADADTSQTRDRKEKIDCSKSVDQEKGNRKTTGGKIMPLIENDIFGPRDRVEIAIKRLKTFEPPEGYWVAVSGGKDSTVIYDLVHRSGCKATYHHNLTTIDPPEVIWHIRKHQPDVVIHRPKMPLLARMVELGMPPLRMRRWCCAEYKESKGIGRIVTGIRAQESAKRANRKIMEPCFKDKRKDFINPILDWSDADVWEYIKSRKLPYLSLYDEGYKRVGCVLCPMTRTVERDKKRFPKIYEAWRKAIYRLFEKQQAKGKLEGYKNAEEFWQWWLDRDAPSKQPSDQTVLFE